MLEAFLSKIDGAEDYLDKDNYKGIMKAIQKETGVKGKPLYMAIRAGITRSVQGPDMDSVATLINTCEMKRRIRETMEIAGIK
ncbi:MAG: hypothetical protein K2N67_01010 [Mucispirillum sp.]|nr:hypothetical protein [Mucispirillum sp.]